MKNHNQIPRVTFLIAMTLTLGMLAKAAIPPAGTPVSIDLKLATSTVEFLAVARPGGIQIRGKSKKEAQTDPVLGKIDVKSGKLSGKAKFHLDSLDTGIEMRNKHMKKYLETEKYPEAELTFENLSIPPEGNTDPVPFEGTLILHGKSHSVTGKVRLKREDSGINMAFEFDLALDDFGIEQPAFMGIKVQNTVSASVEVSSPWKVD